MAQENVKIKQEKREIDEELIMTVEGFPELYDQGHQKYLNNVHKAALWADISKRTGIAGLNSYN
jgi:hypothetical protein